ncbi:FHA domain-containing protein [Tautonia sociabilis]|uniref:FHA domain-containing protein n=1 Tax=Tautonia sociabilis TaxID=2080755 RepID=A0A432MML8_9BACT|nr:FHA domain-containing protein [Tautonia sociabilis]RUL88345.1 FHA domain-containing protein [Tautonia sociabilis]
MNRQSGGIGWSLEVIRGREVGRRFPLLKGRSILGNGVGDGDGIDLSGQEGDSPRRMAARQAVVELGADGPSIRDLDSPGGTFVNKRRLLPDQSQPLRDGDLLQLGGVQLRVVGAPAGRETAEPSAGPTPTRAASVRRPGASATARPVVRSVSRPNPRPTPTPSPAPSPSPTPTTTSPMAFALKGGPVCRSWDDFLTVSAQRWGELREELTSGRLAAYLVSTGRGDLAPRADAPGAPDERLDAWLGSLPVGRPARPELEVHPRSITVRATPGARTRRTIRVSNVGFRLLRSTARVEPAGAAWLAVASEFSHPFTTVEETEVVVEVTVPDPFPGKMTGAVVIDGNGGSARVAIVLEAPEARGAEPFGESAEAMVGGAGLDEIGERWAGWLARFGMARRVIGGAVLGLGVRLGIGAASGLSGLATLPGPAVVLAATGAVAGAIAAGRRGGPRDVPAGGFAGGFAGLVVAAVAVAACQAIEPILGTALSGNLVAVSVLWTAIGAVLGAASILAVPERSAGQGGTP